MRRALVALLVLLTAAGCGGHPPIVERVPSPGPSSSTTTVADPVDVYAAAISRYLTGRENSFPGTTFPVVFVLDRLDPAAASPERATATGPTTALTSAQQQRIAAVVGAGTDLRFVSGLDAVATTTPGNSCQVVRDNGVFIALGPAKSTGADTAEVAVHGFVACEGATWFTYVLRRDATGWAVTGTTGPMAVA